jgi:oligopeptide transport system substrate-binding protein
MPGMNIAAKTSISINRRRLVFAFCCVFLWLITSLIFFGCADLQKPKLARFYGGGKIEAPKKQEFRWVNGKLPKQLDPALAAAPPETDLVRAVYEGLTDLDPQTLEAKPSVAESWDVSPDGRTWTFHLRRDAKWSNNKAVTAKDFARSWRRLAEMGAAVAHSKLLKNIVGAENFAIDDGISILPPDELEEPAAQSSPQTGEAPAPETTPTPDAQKDFVPRKKPSVQKWFGVEAVDDLTLRVWLIHPDANFAAVAAHPIFRPVYDDVSDTSNLNTLAAAPKAVTNGAFHVMSVGKDQVELARSDLFWGAAAIKLDKVFMLARPDAESALTAYQANEVDAITNTHLEPLALKLLAPYDDYRRTRHNALTFYQFNMAHAPFDDARVRRALAMAIERETFVQDEMESAGEAAFDFLPFAVADNDMLREKIPEAKKLLADAGFADTAAFPKIRLLINRNDLQRRIAQSVARMWQKNLGVQAEIVIKEGAEYEDAIEKGDYDLARRGVVLPTVSETASLLMLDMTPPAAALSPGAGQAGERQRLLEKYGLEHDPAEQENTPGPQTETLGTADTESAKNGAAQNAPESAKLILTEKQAMELLPAIPLYFPVSNSLVKPYVSGFDMNLLDAPSLKTVVINYKWKESQSHK